MWRFGGGVGVAGVLQQQPSSASFLFVFFGYFLDPLTSFLQDFISGPIIAAGRPGGGSSHF